MRPWKFSIESDGEDFFVIADGDLIIAKRGRPGTPQAGTWIPLEPGWSVIDVNYPEAIEIRHEGVLIQ
jgi:hypothetical protein